MRILLINPNTTSAVTDLIAARARLFAGDDVTFHAVTARFGARYIASRAASAIAAHAALDALAEHADGCDAVYLACFGDPGLPALQEMSSVPVVGMAEASCLDACKVGKRFSIVTGGAVWAPMLREYVTSLGLFDRLAGIRTIAPTGDRIACDPDAVLSDLAHACQACATDDGADVVILGGAALAGLATRIQPNVSVPVLCSVEVGTRAVIKAATGTAGARQGLPISAVGSIGISSPLSTLLEHPAIFPPSQNPTSRS